MYRLCTICDLKQVEDEKHFLLVCPRYDALREQFYQSCVTNTGGKWDFKKRPPDEAFLILMQGSGDEHEMKLFGMLHSHLEKCFKLRKKTVEGTALNSSI